MIRIEYQTADGNWHMLPVIPTSAGEELIVATFVAVQSRPDVVAVVRSRV